MISFGAPLGTAFATSGWGDDRSYRGGVHEGLDFRAAVGTPVYAVADGVVTTAKTVMNDDPSGLWVGIKHPFIGSLGITSRYMHLSKVMVQKGQTVRKGQQIGLSGATGIKQSAAHLHFDLKLDSSALPEWIRLFGKPSSGFPSSGNTTAVPSEPVIPVDGWKTDAKGVSVSDRSLSRGVAIASAAGGLGAALTLLAVGYFAWRYFRKRS